MMNWLHGMHPPTPRIVVVAFWEFFSRGGLKNCNSERGLSCWGQVYFLGDGQGKSPYLPMILVKILYNTTVWIFVMWLWTFFTCGRYFSTKISKFSTNIAKIFACGCAFFPYWVLKYVADYRKREKNHRLSGGVQIFSWEGCLVGVRNFWRGLMTPLPAILSKIQIWPNLLLFRPIRSLNFETVVSRVGRIQAEYLPLKQPPVKNNRRIRKFWNVKNTLKSTAALGASFI